jgi:hypothetical protein
VVVSDQTQASPTVRHEDATPTFISHGEVTSFVALSVTSAFLGINVSKIPDGIVGGLMVAIAIIFLTMLLAGLSQMTKAWHHRRWVLACFLSISTLFLAIWFGAMLSMLIRNSGIGFGITIGWWLTTFLPLLGTWTPVKLLRIKR